MRGRMAVTHYTDSFIRMLSGRVPDKSKSKFHEAYPQQRYQPNNRRANIYQNRRENIDLHGQTWKKSDNSGSRNQGNPQQYGSNIRVSNRFDTGDWFCKFLHLLDLCDLI